MEEKNTALMQTNVSLEEDLRKANAAKAQLETYKRQVHNQQLCRFSENPNFSDGWSLLCETIVSVLYIGGWAAEQAVRRV